MTVRLEAAKRGEKKYLGSPCKRGHNGWRYTTSGGCIQCVVVSNQAFRDNFIRILTEASK